VIIDLGALFPEQIHDHVGGCLPVVWDSRFVGDAEDKNPAATECLSAAVHGLQETVHDMSQGIPRVDLSRRSMKRVSRLYSRAFQVR